MAEIAQLPYDIIEPVMPPPAPPDFTWAIVAGTVLAIVSIMLAVYHWRRTRLRRLARRRLEQARRAFVAGALPGHDAAYAIAEVLRTGFGARHVTATAASSADWRAFVERLDQTRYGASGADQKILDDLFAEARFWLRGKSPC